MLPLYRVLQTGFAVTAPEYLNKTFTRWAIDVIRAARALVGFDDDDVAVRTIAKGNCSWCGELVVVSLRRNKPDDPDTGDLVMFESDDVRGDLILYGACDHRAGHRVLFASALDRLGDQQ